MNKGALFISVGLLGIGAWITVIVAQGQNTWLVRNTWLAPSLLVLAVLSLLIAVREWPWFRSLFWKITRVIVPPEVGQSGTDAQLTETDQAFLKDIQRQIADLTAFEIFAIARLLLTDGMDGSHFCGLIRDLGFPILSLQQQRVITETFETISGKTTFLESDENFRWFVKTNYQGILSWMIRRASPIFGS